MTAAKCVDHTPCEHNNLGDALTELRELRADLARAAKPTADLLAELADTRRTLTSVKQQRDRLDVLYRRMVSDAADVRLRGVRLHRAVLRDRPMLVHAGHGNPGGVMTDIQAQPDRRGTRSPFDDLDRHTGADLFALVRRSVAWLDRTNGRSEAEVRLRILKVMEEAGEVAQAVIGAAGQNPRKGKTHSVDDVAGELVDVAVTALVALQSLTYVDSSAAVAAKVQRIGARLDDLGVAS